MPKFLLNLDMSLDKLTTTLPSVRRIVEIARENNTRVELAKVKGGSLLALICENQPRDIEGCEWVKEEE